MAQIDNEIHTQNQRKTKAGRMSHKKDILAKWIRAHKIKSINPLSASL